MPDGSPIDQWWKSHRPPRSVSQAQALHMFDARRNRAVCGRRTDTKHIAFPPDGVVSCADCIAAIESGGSES